MYHKLTKQELISLENEFFKEAEAQSGTWSLESIGKLNEFVIRFKQCEANQFISDIAKKIISQETLPLTRFKLSQLCRIISKKRLPQFEFSFDIVKNDLLSFCNKLTKGNLVDATVTHILSLYQEHNPIEIQPPSFFSSLTQPKSSIPIRL